MKFQNNRKREEECGTSPPTVFVSTEEPPPLTGNSSQKEAIFWEFDFVIYQMGKRKISVLLVHFHCTMQFNAINYRI